MDLDPLAQSTPEQEKSKEADNARKFVAEPLPSAFLKKHNAVTFLLVTDWTETGKDDEAKVVYKKFDNGDVEIFRIWKTTKDGKRTKEKEPITEEEYKKLLGSSKRHVEKNRHEFTYTQNGTSFTVNYDEFAGGKFFMLDVDAKSKDKEERDLFDPHNFPVKLVEVSDDQRYSGHKIAEIL